MAHPLYELGLDGQGVNLQSFALLDGSNSYTTLVTADSSICPGSFVIEDDGDVFQCGRCKKQFDSLTLFMRHKREGCNCTGFIESSITPGKEEFFSKPFVHESFPSSEDGHHELHEGSSYLPESDSTSVGVERALQESTRSSILPTVELTPHHEVPPASQFLPAVGGTQSSTPVITITPSVLMGDETLSFTIPIDQNSTGLMQLLTGGTNSSSNSAVITIPETELAALLSSGERFHFTTSGDPANPVNHIYLTTSVLPSALKESSVIHVTKHSPTSNDGGTLGEITIVPGSQLTRQENISVRQSVKSVEAGNNCITSVLKIRETNVQSIKGLPSHLTDASFTSSSVPNQSSVIMGNNVSNNKQLLNINPPDCTEISKKIIKKAEIAALEGEDYKGATEVKRKCEYCGKHFKKLFNLHQHIRSHTGEKPFHCLVCGRGFTQKSNVKKHMQTHKVWPKVKYTLPKEQISVKVKHTSSNGSGEGEGDGSISKEGVSGLVVEPAESLEYVVNNVYVCQYCDQHFENYHKLKTHLSHTHKNEKLFKCIHKDCLATFLEVEGLINHMKTHEDQIEYECQSCPKKFKNICDLGAHQYNHRLFPPKATESSSNGSSNTTTTSSAQAKQFRCTKCNSKYASSEALNHHLLTSSHNYPCSQCKLTFVCERYLRRHLRIHGTVEPFRCELCGKMFKTENYLKSHLVIHSDSKPFHCEICKLSFNRRDKLTRHKLMHDNRKKYKCPYKSSGCEREFYRKDKLKDHMMSHSRKNYTCSKCGKNFAWPTKLRQHQVEQHPEMMANTTCPTCNKIFKTKHHLKLHICRVAAATDSQDTSTVTSQSTPTSSTAIAPTAEEESFLSKQLDRGNNEEIFGGTESQQERNKLVILYNDDLEEEDGCSPSMLLDTGDRSDANRRRDRKEDAMLSSFSTSTEDPESAILSRYATDEDGRDEEEVGEGSLIMGGSVVDMSSFENTVVVNSMDDFIHPD